MRGLVDKVKRTKVLRFLREQQIDIACLQETHFTQSKHRVFNNEWGGKVIYSDGQSSAGGVVVMFDRKLNIENLRFKKDNNGRYLSVSFTIDQVTMLLVNLYAPIKDNEQFFAEVVDKLQYSTEDHIMLMGDFNQI